MLEMQRVTCMLTIIVYKTGISFNDLKGNFQNSVNDAELWYRNNRLPVNILKTFCMISASSPKLRELKENDFQPIFSFDDQNLDVVDTCDYLGVSLDSDLKWESQIKRICRNVSYKLSLLSRLKKILSKELLRKIYVSNIQPCLEYGISIWGYSSEKISI